MRMKDLNGATLEAFCSRVARVESDAQRQWGKMSAVQMLRHLDFTVQLSLGEATAPDLSLPVLRHLMHFFAFVVFTRWPRGMVKAPGFFFPAPEGDLAAERESLIRNMRRFVGALERDPLKKALNPMQGWITLRRWSRIHGLHVDHHLRQFGV
jgi:hypothetical protein